MGSYIWSYLMAAANAADPKTERKTKAERPAVSLGRVGPRGPRGPRRAG